MRNNPSTRQADIRGKVVKREATEAVGAGVACLAKGSNQIAWLALVHCVKVEELVDWPVRAVEAGIVYNYH